MPIDYSHYPDDWADRRARVLKRAKNRCEYCGVPNHVTVFWCCQKLENVVNLNARAFRIKPVWYGHRLLLPQARNKRSLRPERALKVAAFVTACQMRAAVCTHKRCFAAYKIILTTAHLDRTGAPGDGDGPLDCPDDRLAALCQSCHLKLDAKRHAAKAAQTRAVRRQAQFETAAIAPLLEL